ADRKVFWTYHASMRLVRRALTRTDVFGAAPGFVLVESYPDDKYLPSYLVLGFTSSGPIHVLIGTTSRETMFALLRHTGRSVPNGRTTGRQGENHEVHPMWR